MSRHRTPLLIGGVIVAIVALIAAANVVFNDSQPTRTANGTDNESTLDDRETVPPQYDDDATPLDNAIESVRANGPFALGEDGSVELNDQAFGEPLVERNEISDGGPGPDGIPAIDHPTFLSVADVGFIKPNEPVISVTIEGETRAYPLQVMIWHEIVNDQIGGVPVTVTYCPLCNSAFVWERSSQFDPLLKQPARILSFGTSGKLYNSSLVMFDRQTRSLWSHFDGRALAGQYSGAELLSRPASIVAWSDFENNHPQAWVLSRNTGERRTYGVNPYAGYDDIDNPPFLFNGEIDGQLEAKRRVVGIRSGSDALAITFSHLREQRVVEFELDGNKLVALWKPGASSALDDYELSAGKSVGSVSIFSRVIDGQLETFTSRRDDTFAASNGVSYNILGVPMGGAESETQLAPVEHVDTFWFAWSAFEPETRVIA